jgi:pimeloyl-ACP methyl ester carboxylesterase
MPRRTVALLAVAGAGAAGTALAAKRSLDARIARWDTNPDHCDGDPLGLPDTDRVEVLAADGARLRGHRCGAPDGRTVLLVHGYTDSVRSWAPVVRRLVDTGLDVVLVDQRGHGDSDRGDAAFDTETLADDVRVWIDQLDLHDAVLVGHCSGGIGAMAFAGRHPDLAADRLRSMVLVATVAHPAPLAGLPGIQLDPDRAVRAIDRLVAHDTLGLLVLSRAFGTYPTRCALEATRERLLATDAGTRADALTMLRSFDLRPVLPDVAMPTLVLAGSHDRLTPLAGNESIAELIPDARLEVLPGMGHMLLFEAPDAISDAIVGAAQPVGASR